MFSGYLGLGVYVNAVDFPCRSGLTPRAEYTSGRRYYRECQALTFIPPNIPAEAYRVEINFNNISTLRANEFSQLSQCVVLILHSNKIREIHPHAFFGLKSLATLFLYTNEISHIKPGTLSMLTELRNLYVQNAGLTSLPWTVFTSLDNMNHPASLTLRIERNPLQCDTSVCWMRRAEQDGWLTWAEYNGRTFYPECANLPSTAWPNVGLNCDFLGRSITTIPAFIVTSGLIKNQCMMGVQQTYIWREFNPILGPNFQIQSSIRAKIAFQSLNL